MNAPRVLRSIDADFIVQAKVSGNLRHVGRRTSGLSVAYHGAGFLIWQNAGNYVPLERAGLVREDGRTVHFANFELHGNGEVVVKSMEIPDKDTYLRLERRGDRASALVSPDGSHWSCFDPIGARLSREVKLGVAAISTSTEPLKVVFSELELYTGEPKRSQEIEHNERLLAAGAGASYPRRAGSGSRVSNPEGGIPCVAWCPRRSSWRRSRAPIEPSQRREGSGRRTTYGGA
jgi:regulation of enolase protein 1 (concanavalin A-like superfamily)